MFLRFLGRVFLYFYLLPALSRGVKKIILPSILKTLDEQLKEQKKERDDRARSRENHPAGSRL